MVRWPCDSMLDHSQHMLTLLLSIRTLRRDRRSLTTEPWPTQLLSIRQSLEPVKLFLALAS